MIDVRTVNTVFIAFCVPYLVLLAASLLPIIDYGRTPPGVYVLSGVWLAPICVVWAATNLLARTGRTPRRGRAHRPERSSIADRTRSNFTRRDMQVATVIALVYLLGLAKVYVIDGSVLSDGVTASRYARIAAGGGVDFFGVMTLVTSGAPGILGAIYVDHLMAARRQLRYMNVVLPVAFMGLFLSGGRNGFALNLFFLASFMVLRTNPWHSKGAEALLAVRNLQRRTKVLAAAGFAYSMQVFLTRVNVRTQSSLTERLYAFEDDFGFKLQALQSSGSGVGTGSFLVTNLFLYLTAAFFNIGKYFQGSEYLATNGGYTFYPFALMLDVVVGTNIAGEVFDRLALAGVYYTLPGSLYIDFGLIGTGIASLLWTTLAIVTIGRARRHGGARLLLASYVILVLLVSGLFSAFALASGPSLLLLSLLFMARQTIRRSMSKSTCTSDRVGPTSDSV